MTCHTLFGLIAVTGMRTSEAMSLERDDVDLDAGVLTVRLTKFGKSRLLPLHATTCAALHNYANRCDAHLGSHCGPTFFVTEQGRRLLHQYVHRVFWRLSPEIGLRRPGDRTGPRLDVDQSSVRYQKKREPDDAERRLLHELAVERHRFGYRHLREMARRAGHATSGRTARSGLSRA